MSVRRTSGAIPKITARQMATASLAVPKSVMNTIVEREECIAAGVSCGTGDLELEHAEQKTISARRAEVSSVESILLDMKLTPDRICTPVGVLRPPSAAFGLRSDRVYPMH